MLSGSFPPVCWRHAGRFPGHVTAVFLVDAIVLFFLGELSGDYSAFRWRAGSFLAACWRLSGSVPRGAVM